MQNQSEFWTQSPKTVLQSLKASPAGLSEAEAQERLAEQQRIFKTGRPWHGSVLLLMAQFKSPLVLLLAFAAVLSIVLGEYSDSFIVLTILIVSGVLGFIQERNAGKAVQKLRELVHSSTTVKRGGAEREVPIEEVVPGDIVLLNAGDMIPADALILEANDLHVNESVLTGESFPAEKFASASFAVSPGAAQQKQNHVFKGTSVVNGTAVILCVNTGGFTELGKITSSLGHVATVTAFEKGVMQFGYLLMRLTVLFTGLILILNIVFHRSFIESLLFSLALTVGLTPELLPAILTITLAAGAKRMAARKVIVKKLSAIQNLGEIDVLCSDKTGTITEGVVRLHATEDMNGSSNAKVLLYAYLNASFETGFTNPIDESIRQTTGIDISAYRKADEVPYDFIRKKLSVVAANGSRHLMITKGAVDNVLQVCDRAEAGEDVIINLPDVKERLEKRFAELSRQGFRVIALAYKDVTGDPVINKDDETQMIFLGFLVFSDPVKSGMPASIAKLREQGIRLKIITGDNRDVAVYVGRQVQLRTTAIVTGDEMSALTSDALQRRAEETDVFAEILPAQKERIVKALQQAGHSVGYLGDGINDANALKSADVGISINNAVDVAREAADIVLMDRDLDVVSQGVQEGRKTFMNTLKYILVSTSANFGNMFSLALASLIFPFFPLLPVQILLNNFLSDLPAIAISSDHVDSEMTVTPRRWSIRYISRFMTVFGLQSSLFDFATFGLLYYIFRAPVNEFRTAWFMESLLTEVLVLLIIRTQRPFFKSKPSAYLLMATVFTFLACISIPYLPFARWFQLYPLPVNLLLSILVLVGLYIVVAEVSKRLLIQHL